MYVPNIWEALPLSCVARCYVHLYTFKFGQLLLVCFEQYGPAYYPIRQVKENMSLERLEEEQVARAGPFMFRGSGLLWEPWTIKST